MNVKLNKRIQEMEEIEQAWFLPSCGDESKSLLGAAHARAVELNLPLKPLVDLYLGISYSRASISTFIDKNSPADQHTITEPTGCGGRNCQITCSGEVVARFSGCQGEWGARSQGNRAILAHPSYLESFYTVNELIKARDLDAICTHYSG